MSAPRVSGRLAALLLAALLLAAARRAGPPLQSRTTGAEPTGFRETHCLRRRAGLPRRGRRVPGRTDRPAGGLAAYLLEPASEDGLATWNLMDRELQPHAG